MYVTNFNEGKLGPVVAVVVNYQLKAEELRNNKIFITQDLPKDDYGKRKFLLKHLKAARVNHVTMRIRSDTLIVNDEEFTYDHLKNNTDLPWKELVNIATNKNEQMINLPADPERARTKSTYSNSWNRTFPESPTNNTGPIKKVCTRSQDKKEKGLIEII
ncbi:hypothetical protein JTB14_033595 [Gonioctena quinquepunctata]|nr:hypothetical protein JTB14_033595 [Gonioctena quinquepunctata]